MATAQEAPTATNSAEAEIIRSAQLWIAKNRTDLARQHIEKLLRLQSHSEWGRAILGDIALREGKADEARTQMDWLKAHAPTHAATRELTTLSRVMGPDSQKLATMRLMAQAGRQQEAAELARSLFPEGPPTSGTLAIEYYQIVGNAVSPKDASMNQALQQQYARTGDARYRILALQRQLQVAPPTPAMLKEIDALAGTAGTDEASIRGVWRWAIDKLPWSATIPAAQNYLRRYPEDASMQQLLEKARNAVQEQQRIDNSPLNVAKRAADRALGRNDLPAAQAAFQRALRISPKDADALGGLGIVAMRQGQHAQAQDYFSQAISADRSTQKWVQLRNTSVVWGSLQRGSAALETGDLDTADSMVQQALAQEPSNAEALHLHAQVLVARGDKAGAEQTWLTLHRQHPTSTSALRALVALYVEQGRLNDAEQLLSRSLVQNVEDQRELRSEILQAQAELALAKQQPVAAMEAMEQALQLTPANAWLRHRLARLYIERQQQDLGNAVMADGIALFPQDPSMRQASALVWLAQDQPAHALSDLQAIPHELLNDAQKELLQEAKLQALIQKALSAKNTNTQKDSLLQAQSLAGDRIDNIRQIANAWFDINQPQEALNVWQHYRQMRPADKASDLPYAQALVRANASGELDHLLPALRQQREWSPTERLALLDLETSTQERQIRDTYAQSPVAAQQMALHAELPQGDGIADTQYMAARARLFLAAQDGASALPLLQQALDSTPQDFDLQVDTANAWILIGQPEQARPLAQQAQSQAASQAPWRQLSLVRLWQRLGDTQSAQTLLDGLMRNPQSDRTDLLLHAARLQRAQSNYAQASQYFEQALTEIPVTSEVQRAGVLAERNAIEARRQAWVETGLLRLRKSGDDGRSTLNGWEIPMVAWIPRGYEGPQFVHVDRVVLNAGVLPSITAGNVTAMGRDDAIAYPNNFGQTAALAAGASSAGAQNSLADRYNQSPRRSQSSNGYNIGTGHEGEDFGWDIGLTGIGLPVTNLVGGLRWSLPTWHGNDWTLRLQRRPVTGSLLSYAGAYDPLTGRTWGGVVLNSTSVTAARDTASGWALSASASLGVYTGKNVASNARTQLRLSAGRDVWRSRSQRVYAGATLTGTTHQRDLSEYTWGHGGYYSPKRSLSLSLPVEWTGREGSWAWRVQGSVSLSQTGSSRSALYPRSVASPPAWQQTADALHYSSNGGFGTGWAFSAAVERQITPQLAVGGQIALDRSEYYAPTNVMLYARFFLDPVHAPLVNYPRPVTPYSQY